MGYDPRQPRNKDGEWTVAGNAARKAAGLLPTEDRDYVAVVKDPVKAANAERIKPIYKNAKSLQKSLGIPEPVKGYNWIDVKGNENRSGDSGGLVLKIVDPEDVLERTPSDGSNEKDVAAMQKSYAKFSKPENHVKYNWRYGTVISMKVTGSAGRQYADKIEQIRLYLTEAGLSPQRWSDQDTRWSFK